MDLSQLVYNRLVLDDTLSGMLAKFNGQPAVFNTEFPSDQQEGWEGKTQYPRIEYHFNMQADAQRASSGMLMLAIYTEKNPAAAEKIESFVRRVLKDVLMMPSEEAPFCVAWARTDPYMLEGTAILCKELVFDILEFPETFATYPDPVESMSLFLKEAFPEMFVIGVDRINEYQVATEDIPVVYCRLDLLQNDHTSMALAWVNCRIAIHVIAPTADARSKWVRLITNCLMLFGEAVMTDGTPLRFTGTQAANTSDYLTSGQIILSGQYTLPRPRHEADAIMNVEYKYN